MTRSVKSLGIALFSALAVMAALVVLPSSGSGATAPSGLDHFKCYNAKSITQPGGSFLANPLIVTLTDEFGTWPVIVNKTPNRLCNPAEKTVPPAAVGQPPEVTPITNPDAHLVCWMITRPPTLAAPTFNVRVTNQFGDADLTTTKATELCVPSWKSLTAANLPPDPTSTPPGLDHFECYAAAYTKNAAGKPVNTFEAKPQLFSLSDEFSGVAATASNPVELCNPVQKVLPTGEVYNVSNAQAHLVCFGMRETPPTPTITSYALDQFGRGTLSTAAGNKVCLPSYKDILPGV